MENIRQKKEMIARACVLYYEYQKSQNTIARELGISRSYVSQLLTLAKDKGLVKIIVNVSNDFRREVAFKKKFPYLKYAYIMNSDSIMTVTDFERTFQSLTLIHLNTLN